MAQTHISDPRRPEQVLCGRQRSKLKDRWVRWGQDGNLMQETASCIICLAHYSAERTLERWGAERRAR